MSFGPSSARTLLNCPLRVRRNFPGCAPWVPSTFLYTVKTFPSAYAPRLIASATSSGKSIEALETLQKAFQGAGASSTALRGPGKGYGHFVEASTQRQKGHVYIPPCQGKNGAKRECRLLLAA